LIQKVTPEMKIIRAEHLGMCFGVRDAIALALKESQAGPITILGDLVHNDTVLDELRHRGVEIQTDVRNVATTTVMITAHGTSIKRINQARELGLNVLSAACPLVEVAYDAVKGLVREGFHPVVIGKRDHIEVRGLTEDFDEYDVVSNEEDVRQLQARPKFGVVAQTTQPADKVRHLTNLIRETFPDSEVRYSDTVCRPTKERQNAAADIAQRCDVVIVIGGANSNNTRELVQTCSRYCRRVYHIQTAADLRKEWFRANDNVGITAGTSTPDHVVNAVERDIRELSDA
jgi:4-hydroxy-3-methylbut-2-enyl diphosphate reductase